jgi:hypothetical protein
MLRIESVELRIGHFSLIFTQQFRVRYSEFRFKVQSSDTDGAKSGKTETVLHT